MNSNFSNYRKLFLKYLLFFTVPIIILTCFFLFNLISVNSDNIEDFNYSLLTQTSQEFDLFYSTMKDVAIRLSSSTINPFNEIEYESLLRSLSTREDKAVSMLFYTKDPIRIFVDVSFYDYHEFENFPEYDIGLSISGLFTAMNSMETQYILPIRSSSIYSTALIFPIPYVNTPPVGTLCFLLKNSFFSNLINDNFSGLLADFSIFDAKNDVIYGSEDFLSGVRLQEIKPGVSSRKIFGKSYIFMKVKSPQTGFTYLAISERVQFFSSITTTIAILVGLSVILLAFSASVAIFIARNSYLEKKAQEKISKELTYKNSLLKEMVLRRLFFGTIRDGDAENLTYNLNCAGFVFDLPLFTTAIIQINVMNIDEQRIADYENKVYFQSKDLVIYPCFLPLETRLILITNHSADWTPSGITETVIKNLPSDLSEYRIGTGSTHSSVYQIDNSYIEASISLLNSRDRINYYKKNSLDADGTCRYPIIEEEIINQAIRNGSIDSAYSAIDCIYDIIIHTPSQHLQKAICIDLVNFLVKLGNELHCPIMSDRVNGLFTYENHESLIADLKDIVFDLTENYKRKRIEQSTAIKHKVVNYVQDHYKDGALSLELLSSEFNLSFPYINKIFKEETGNTFKIYLTAIRFSSIKKQLRTANTPIIEIINEHGYMDSANFMRKFKVAEGMTMGQYRSGHSLPLPNS